MHHQNRGVRQKLQGEVPIGNRVQRVAGDGRKIQLLGDIIAIYVEGSARQRPGSQGKNVDPLEAIIKPLPSDT